VGRDFIIIFRISGLDLVEDGCDGAEVEWLASQMEDAGATMLNTGIGWHEARVPTIAGMVPRGAFGWVSARIKAATRLPVIATNRFNSPADAEALLGSESADLILDGAAAARGCRTCRARRSRAVSRRSTPASPATRAASTGSSRAIEPLAW
jgi:2,4-dienoyl-CoA reductase-like NADH-dependent reductase (Old Yellow Enzyme family)